MSTTTEAPVLTSKADGVLTLTLNRPQELNALTNELIDQLREQVEQAADDDDVRAILITGAGRAFSSGASLTGGNSDIETTLAKHYNPAILAIQKLEKPVVAAINGIAAGAGASVALACDMRVMSDNAKLALLFVRIGLAPDAGASYFLPRLIGVTRATELLMLGEDVSAEQALDYAIVNRVFPADSFEADARAFVQRCAAAPRSAGLVKRLMRKSMNLNLPDQLGVETKVQIEASQTQDFQEGVMAFMQKRKADFSGR